MTDSKIDVPAYARGPIYNEVIDLIKIRSALSKKAEDEVKRQRAEAKLARDQAKAEEIRAATAGGGDDDKSVGTCVTYDPSGKVVEL